MILKKLLHFNLRRGGGWGIKQNSQRKKCIRNKTISTSAAKKNFELHWFWNNGIYGNVISSFKYQLYLYFLVFSFYGLKYILQTKLGRYGSNLSTLFVNKVRGAVTPPSKLEMTPEIFFLSLQAFISALLGEKYM